MEKYTDTLKAVEFEQSDKSWHEKENYGNNGGMSFEIF